MKKTLSLSNWVIFLSRIHYQDQLVHPEHEKPLSLSNWLVFLSRMHYEDQLVHPEHRKKHFHFLIGIICDISGMHTAQKKTHSWWSLHQGYTLSSTHLISLSLQQMVRSLLASSSMTLVSVFKVVIVVRAAIIVLSISATFNVSIKVI